MAPGEHRPLDSEYWRPAWSSVLFSGDLFAAIPFGNQPIELFEGEDDHGELKHYLGEVAFGFGLLVSPTCDMVDQRADGLELAHPFRVLVPVLPLEAVAQHAGGLEKNLKLIRSRDPIHPYMYLPPLPGQLEEESVACLFRPTLVSDDYLRDPPRRVSQMQPEARRHLKIKLAAYWARAAITKDDLPLHERFEEEARSTTDPPSPYDT